MKHRSSIKTDLFAAEARSAKIDRLGDPLTAIEEHIDFAALAVQVDPPGNNVGNAGTAGMSGPGRLRGLAMNKSGLSAYHFFMASIGVECPSAFWGK